MIATNPGLMSIFTLSYHISEIIELDFLFTESFLINFKGFDSILLSKSGFFIETLSGSFIICFKPLKVKSALIHNEEL